MYSSGFYWFYRAGEYFFLLLYLNVLWVVFTLLGGVVFGWAPSTTALLAIIRSKIVEKKTDRIITEFWNVYRQEFLKTNTMGLILVGLAGILYVNLTMFKVDGAAFQLLIQVFKVGIGAIYILMFLYIFPLFVTYQTGFLRYFKNAILLAFYKPIRTFYTVGATATVLYLFYSLPVLIPFLSVSLIGFVIMWTSHGTFLRIEQKSHIMEQDLIAEESGPH